MANFAHDNVVPYKDSELTKKEQVAGMFNDIAGRYDFLNRFLSAGIDISDGMLDIGRKKIEKLGLQNKIELLNGDSEAINFPDNSFDAVTVAFGVRNFQHLEKGLSEIKRVLKPGGKLVVLEFSKPSLPFVKPVYQFYMKVVTPSMGKLFSKNREAYKYLDESIKKFPEGKNFTQILDQLGYQQSFSKSLSLGICSIYCGVK